MSASYFVTGATGFIGRHLLQHLLERDGTIYVLVREGSRGRLKEVLARLGADESRVQPVVGDLTKPGAGVDGPPGPIDHFFHLAAVYDMEADEQTMVRANVEGTRHAVELANELGASRFHHVSSIAVAGRYQGVFLETMFDEGQPLPHAYHRTKFESERVAREQVRGRLLVYRPGIVVGHSRTGEADRIDGPYYFFKLIQRLRYVFPQWFPLAGPEGGQTNIVPVDFVAAALDYIAHLPDERLPGDTFHLVDPRPLSVGQAINEFARAAHAPQLALRVDRRITDAVPRQLRAFLRQVPTVRRIRETFLRDFGIPPAAWENRDFLCRFDCRQTLAALEGSGIACPPLSSYAGHVWDYWERHLDPDLYKERGLAAALRGKVVLITGASSGIGRATALELGKAGGEVVLVARTREKLEEVAREVERLGGKAHVEPCDLTDMDEIEQMGRRVLERLGRVDILINNAGKSIRRSLEREYDRFHDFERTMRINYFGAVKLIMTLLPSMRRRRSGHIINISSIGVQTNPPRFSAYVASKAALDAFSRCAAPETIGDGVKFTTVYMPLVRTPMIEPTSIYKAFPTLSPEEAAAMICDAIIKQPKRKASRLGTFGEVLYAISPKMVDWIMHTAYNMFPDSPVAAGKAVEPTTTSDADGRRPAPSEEIPAEALAMAYLLRGVYL
ncbi:SDR family oxidoreductase [Thermoleophilum album]|uniref:Short-chain dehydrogenase n=1 Tax=Thermoleophilum album TaxID=29539 RepID=A0A1H6FRH4_THEAL|nr:SDR family oxidoreductase [Thermoleophilum album]SEH12345.1 Short-chain dehydrogenase [Thermoleophilum album]